MPKKPTDDHVQLLRSREGKVATLEFHKESYPDGYVVKIIKVEDDGTFTARLVEVQSCM